jgi:hypothetical protein
MTTTILRLAVFAFATRPRLPSAMRRRCASLLVVLGVIAVISLAALIIGLPTRPLVALPLYARQTGQLFRDLNKSIVVFSFLGLFLQEFPMLSGPSENRNPPLPPRWSGSMEVTSSDADIDAV